MRWPFKKKLVIFKDCNGLPVSGIKEIFREQTHCGKYWNVSPSFNPITKVVSISMEGNEKYEYYLKYGFGVRYDWDDDGCSISNDFIFRIKESKIIAVTGIHWDIKEGNYIINPFTRERVYQGDEWYGKVKELIDKMLKVLNK